MKLTYFIYRLIISIATCLIQNTLEKMLHVKYFPISVNYRNVGLYLLQLAECAVFKEMKFTAEIKFTGVTD